MQPTRLAPAIQYIVFRIVFLYLQILYPNMQIADIMSKIIEPAPVMSGIACMKMFNTCDVFTFTYQQSDDK